MYELNFSAIYRNKKLKVVECDLKFLIGVDNAVITIIIIRFKYTCDNFF